MEWSVRKFKPKNNWSVFKRRLGAHNSDDKRTRYEPEMQTSGVKTVGQLNKLMLNRVNLRKRHLLGSKQ